MDLSRLCIVVLAFVVLPQLILGQAVPASNATHSICQDMIPSPTLEMFVDPLPRLKKIRVADGRQITLGAYKIQQVIFIIHRPDHSQIEQ